MDYPITLQRPLPLPPVRPRMDTFLVLATSTRYLPGTHYSNPTDSTRYIPGTHYSNPADVLCTGSTTLLAHKEPKHGCPDSQSTTWGTFYFLVVVKHSTLFICTRYIIPYVLEYYNCIHTWYLHTPYVVYTYSYLYSSIPGTLVSYDV